MDRTQLAAELHAHGFAQWEEPGLAAWIAAANAVLADLWRDPQQVLDWLRCGGTWWAGVNVLNNTPDGALGDIPLPPRLIDTMTEVFGSIEYDAGQISVTMPGYPSPMAGESSAAFRFRHTRDAAHVDGLLPIGPDRRRKMVEPHRFVLGLPITLSPDGGSPLVVWSGSHHLVRAAFRDVLTHHDPTTWAEVDLTEIYTTTRRKIFDTCDRVELPAQPGEVVVLDRLALHGIAPWAGGPAPQWPGRAIVYFRPPWEGAPGGWIDPG